MKQAPPPQAIDGRLARQGDEVFVDFGAVAAAGPVADGKKCIDKVVTVYVLQHPTI